MKITTQTDQNGLSLTWDEVTNAASYEVKICDQNLSETYVDTTVLTPELANIRPPQDPTEEPHEKENSFYNQETITVRAIVTALDADGNLLDAFEEPISFSAAAIAPMSAGITGTAPCGWTHTHSANEITAGTLPLNRGGTGATNAAGAMRSLTITNLGAHNPATLHVAALTDNWGQSGHLSLTQLRGLLGITSQPTGPNLAVGSVVNAQMQLSQADSMAMMLVTHNPFQFHWHYSSGEHASGTWLNSMQTRQVEIPAGWLQFDGVRYAIRRVPATGGWIAVSGRFRIASNNSWCPSWRWSERPSSWENAVTRALSAADMSAPSPSVIRFA